METTKISRWFSTHKKKKILLKIHRYVTIIIKTITVKIIITVIAQTIKIIKLSQRIKKTNFFTKKQTEKQLLKLLLLLGK